MEKKITYLIKQEKTDIQLFLGSFGEFLESYQLKTLKKMLLSLAEENRTLRFYFETNRFQNKKVYSFLTKENIEFQQFDFGGFLGEKGVYGLCKKENDVKLLLDNIWPYYRLLFLVEERDSKNNQYPKSLLRHTVENKNREIPKSLLDRYSTAALEFFHGEFLELRSKEFTSTELFNLLKGIVDDNNVILSKGSSEDF